jgi:hypothetical protein
MLITIALTVFVSACACACVCVQRFVIRGGKTKSKHMDDPWW